MSALLSGLFSLSSTSAYAAGTAYTLTATPTALTFGTTQPTITLGSPGTWFIFGNALVDYVGATLAANQTLTLKLRRTNNTATDLTNGTQNITTGIYTTLTFSLGVTACPSVFYTTTANNDAITIFGSITAIPSAGTVQTTTAYIGAIKIA